MPVNARGRLPCRWTVCHHLARRIRASEGVIEDAGEETQFTGQPINDELLAIWHASRLTGAGSLPINGSASTWPGQGSRRLA
jgi:hypothetical protein